MKIVRAMKKIARLKGEIKEIKHRISSCLNTLVENEFQEDLSTLSKLQDEKTKEMIDLKVKIMKKNVEHDMFALIANLGELKSQLDFLKELEPKTGVQETRFSDIKSAYKSQMTKYEKVALIDECQKQINNLTDMLDEFNARTEI